MEDERAGLDVRIGIEIGWGNRTGGARTVSRKLVAAMAELEPAWRFILLSNTVQGGLELPNVEQHILPVPHPGLYNLYNHLVFPHVQVPRFFSREGVDVVHYTNSIISLVRPFRTVLTLHDFSPFRQPSSWSFFLRHYMRFHLKVLAPRADAIVTISSCSKNDIREILRVPDDKITVVPNAVGAEFHVIRDRGRLEEVRRRLRLPRAFILFVGTIQPRKNLGRLFEAYGGLKQGVAAARGLVVVGRRGWGKMDVQEMARRAGLSGRVVYVENARPEDLPCMYNMADLFVYPSLYEGFGLPPLEAMACGVPVVTSATSAIPEVVGDAAILVDPQDAEDIARGMAAALADGGLRESLIEKGRERVGKFSWTESARRTLDLYREVCNA